ncbi:hypothetical protein FOZ62_001420, partial [Perkinsus olseni]
LEGFAHPPRQPWVSTTITEREEAKSYALAPFRTKNAIFTDGSVVKEKTGAAMVLYRGGLLSNRVPGHSSISANEMADELTAKGASMVVRRYRVQARRRVKGGVPYHLYEIVNDSEGSKSFNQLCLALMQYLDARRGL